MVVSENCPKLIEICYVKVLKKFEEINHQKFVKTVIEVVTCYVIGMALNEDLFALK